MFIKLKNNVSHLNDSSPYQTFQLTMHLPNSSVRGGLYWTSLFLHIKFILQSTELLYPTPKLEQIKPGPIKSQVCLLLPDSQWTKKEKLHNSIMEEESPTSKILKKIPN